MDLAVGRFEKARDQPQRGGLAAAGWAEQANQLPVIDPQRNVIDHRKRAKSLGQAAQINGRQSPHSHSYFLARISARLISTKNDAQESLRVSDFDRIELVDWARCVDNDSGSLSHCERVGGEEFRTVDCR